jgi:hypothetical protein
MKLITRMKRLFLLSSAVMLLIPSVTLAFDISDLWDILEKSYERQVGIDTTTKDELVQLKALLAGLTGTHQYGSFNNDSSQFSWGTKTGDWQSILALYKNGDGGELSRLESTFSKQFPIKDSLGSSNDIENQYYLLQAQTALATRSSSQLAFQQISNESQVIDDLQKQIDKAQDNKSAVDINNRLLAEQNKLSIQQAKMMTLLVQQGLVEAQEKSNRAKENADFFDFK